VTTATKIAFGFPFALSAPMAAPVRCPHCNDQMVAPVSSEFVDGSEIRHRWQCDFCGKSFSTAIPLARA
jgi:transcription elongation factor Elf1